MKNNRLHLYLLLSRVLILAAGRALPGPALAAARMDVAPTRGLSPRLAGEPVEKLLRRGHEGYDGVSDTHVELAYPSVTYGSEALHAKGWMTKYALIKFDLSGPEGIPVGAMVTSASLGLFPFYRDGSSANVSFHHLLQPWVEASANWESRGDGHDWDWGTDYESMPFASATIDVLHTYKSVDVRDAVQRWIDDPGGNHGFLIMSDKEVRFWNSEVPTENERPYLHVIYEVTGTPVPEDTATPTATATGEATATLTPAKVITSTGNTEAYGYECLEALPDDPARTELLLVTMGVSTTAKLSFWYASNNNWDNAVLVNDQEIGRLPRLPDPGQNYGSKCGDLALATPLEIPFDPALLHSGVNTVTILDDRSPDYLIDGWSMQNPSIIVGGYEDLQATKIVTVEIPSSIHPHEPQRSMVQEPLGYNPAIPRPLVVVCHHWSATDFAALTEWAKVCGERGWLLACPDMRHESEHTASLVVQHDVMDLVDYMCDHYAVDPSRIYLVGNSMGGMVAATVACKYPDRFAALADLRGATRLDLWYDEMEPWRRAKIADEIGLPTSDPFSYERKSSWEMAQNLRNVPTFIMHGTEDEIIPYHHATDLYDKMGEWGAEYVQIELYEGGHEDPNPDWDYDRILTDFFVGRTLVTCPTTVTVRADEAKSYYWLDISYTYGASDHWVQVNSSYDLDSQTITAEVYDESGVTVDIAFDLARMGLPTGTPYTVEWLNLDTGWFSAEQIAPVGGSLRLTVQPAHYRIVACPRALPEAQQRALAQGEGGYMGVADTFISPYEETPQEGGSLKISPGGLRTPLLRFDLESLDLPPHVVIKGARLGLYATYQWNPGRTVTSSVYPLVGDWDVTQATWQDRSASEQWSEPGAWGLGTDYRAPAVSSQELMAASKWYYYNLTELVKEWVQNPGDNDGILLRGDGTGTFTLSSSHGSSYKPQLDIAYTEATATYTPTNTPTPTATATATATPTSEGWAYLPVIIK